MKTLKCIFKTLLIGVIAISVIILFVFIASWLHSKYPMLSLIIFAIVPVIFLVGFLVEEILENIK